MRFMIIVKATQGSEAGEMPADDDIAKMGAYHEELAKAGMLLDASGLHPTSRGWRVQYEGDRRTVVEGPFPATGELIAGFTIIQAKSEEEAREWIGRYPNPAHRNGVGEIEVRRLFELEDFEQTPAIERMREQQAKAGAAAR